MGVSWSHTRPIPDISDRGDDSPVQQTNRIRHHQDRFEIFTQQEQEVTDMLTSQPSGKNRADLQSLFIRMNPHLGADIALSNMRQHSHEYWTSPYESIFDNISLKPDIKFYDEYMDFYVHAVEVRDLPRVREPVRRKGGVQHPPAFLRNILNKNVKVHLREINATKNKAFGTVFPEYKYLTENVDFLKLRLEAQQQVGEYHFEFHLSESHRSKKAGPVKLLSRPLYTTSVWMVHSSCPLVILSGIEFDLCLMTNRAAQRIIPGLSNLASSNVVGLYTRRLDTLQNRESDLLSVTWLAEICDHF